MSSARRRRMSAGARREVIEQAALDVFAEHGYHRASIDEIARRAGITPPVVYDHCASKLALHKRLLARTRDELQAMWSAALGESAEERIPRALDAWARYVEAHPHASRMFFVETTGDAEVVAIHREVQEQARAALAGLLGAERARVDGVEVEMATEVMRAGLTGLAVWWSENPQVPRERIVAAAVDVVETGFERVRRAQAPASRVPERP